MLFNSQVFLIGFLPAVLLLYYGLAASRAWRQAAVVLASLVFYGYWDIRFVPLLVGLTVANWLIARLHGAGIVPGVALAGIVLNLAVLGLFKYANFFADSFAAAFGTTHRAWDIILPIGISFFVFQKISYLADLRRGDRHIYGFLDFCMFVAFFPQLIAGPLVRHNEIIHQFDQAPRRAEMWENLSRGLTLLVIGLAKKVGIADTVAGVCDPLFAKAAHASLSMAEAWAAAGTFTLQIYFDFSGYSDMAIGLALMFGLRLPLNFDAPYRATSIRDFWRRWHMTLSRFLRDYVYIPLGGNRLGPLRQAVNVVITMLLGGLWHGANWTFVAWGGLHGAALALNGAWDRAGWRLPRPLGWLLTILFVIACWVLFRAPDFATAGGVLASMTGMHGLGAASLKPAWVVALGAGIALIGWTSQDFVLARLSAHKWIAPLVGILLVLALILIGGRLQHDFIYFQF